MPETVAQPGRPPARSVEIQTKGTASREKKRRASSVLPRTRGRAATWNLPSNALQNCRPARSVPCAHGNQVCPFLNFKQEPPGHRQGTLQSSAPQSRRSAKCTHAASPHPAHQEALVPWAAGQRCGVRNDVAADATADSLRAPPAGLLYGLLPLMRSCTCSPRGAACGTVADLHPVS